MSWIILPAIGFLVHIMLGIENSSSGPKQEDLTKNIKNQSPIGGDFLDYEENMDTENMENEEKMEKEKYA